MQNARPRARPERNLKAAPLPVTMPSVAEVAAYLGCSDMHVYRLITAGELATVNIAGPGARAKMRVPEESLAAFIGRRTAKVAPAG